MQAIPVTCGKDCGGGCPLLAYIENGKIRRIGNNPAGGRAIRGCINGFQMPRVLYSPERLTQPLLRTGKRGSGQFRAVEWEEALDYTAEKLAEIKTRFGTEAILHMAGTGSVACALHNGSALALRFLNLFGGCTVTSGNYSFGAAGFAVPFVLGSARAGIDTATLGYSNLILLWGANLLEARLGAALPYHLAQAKKRGIPIVVIDPRHSATAAKLGAEWIPCKPGTDAALMMAVLYVLIQERMVDRGFIQRCSVGFEDLERYILGESDGIARTPEWAAAVCGTPVEAICQLARLYGRTQPAALIPGFSIQRTQQGEDAFRMAIALQVATGNLGRLGGSSGSNNSMPCPRAGRIDSFRSGRQPRLPVLRWADAILEGKTGGYPVDLHSIYNVASNFLNQGSDVGKNVRAFEKLDFAVCHDYFLTPTARHCDVVFPATTFLERQDIVFPWDGNYLMFSNRAVPPVGGARNDYDILCALADRLGFGEVFSEGKDEEAWLAQFLAESDVPDAAAFRQSGVYFAPDQLRVGLADFARDPENHPLGTPSGKVELASAAYTCQTGFPAIPTFQPQSLPESYPLHLITPKSAYRIHSQGSNIPWMRKQEAQALWINPQDAAGRGIADGALVEVASAQGVARVAARITGDIMPGVVCLQEGVWAALGADGADTAGCANVLTSTSGTLPSKSSTTHGVPVQVRGMEQA